jgi:DNA-binding NarL/FixJ family response regulator
MGWLYLSGYCRLLVRQHDRMADPVSSQPQRVLIIDDHDGFRSVARELLERRGFEVVAEADTGMSGLQAAERVMPDAVLLDVCLPDSNGVEVCRVLTQANPELAVLLTSADELARRRAEVVECGAVAVVPKMRLASLDLGGLLRRAQGDAGTRREEAG